MFLLSPEKDLAICRLLVGWDALEKRLGGNSVIDFNLPGFIDPDADARYGSRLAVLDDLKELQQDSEIIADKRVAQKLRAQQAYLRNVMGEHWEYDAYIENTQGFTPQMFGEEAIAEQRARTETCLSQWNISIDKSLREEINKVQTILFPDQAETLYKTIYDRNAEVLTSVIGPVPDFGFAVEFIAENNNWLNWADGAQKNYRVRLNKTNMPSFGKSYITWLALHEVLGHMVHSVITYDQIEKHRLSRCMGITTVHGPEQFVLEGLAQTLPLFLKTEDTQDPAVQAFTELYIYERMIMNNGIILINSGQSIEEISYNILSDIPYFPCDVINSLLDANLNNPQARSYGQVYGASAVFFRDAAAGLTKLKKKIF